MALKLQTAGFNRNVTPPTIFASLNDEKGNSINVNFPVPHHLTLEKLTVEEIESLAHAAAKQLHP